MPHSSNGGLLNILLVALPVSSFVALMWFTALLLGPVLFFIAFLLEPFLVFHRNLSVWWKLAAAITLGLAARGILLIGAEAQQVRQ